MEKYKYQWEYCEEVFDVTVATSDSDDLSITFHVTESRKYFKSFDELISYINRLHEMLGRMLEAIEDMERVYSFYKKLKEVKKDEK